MAWLDFLSSVPLNPVLRERLALAEQQYKALEIENKKLKEQVAELTAERDALKKQLAEQNPDAGFVPMRGVLWQKDPDGDYTPCCPGCKTALRKVGGAGGMLSLLKCSICKFTAPSSRMSFRRSRPSCRSKCPARVVLLAEKMAPLRLEMGVSVRPFPSNMLALTQGLPGHRKPRKSPGRQGHHHRPGLASPRLRTSLRLSL
jgi:hypothetical protein